MKTAKLTSVFFICLMTVISFLMHPPLAQAQQSGLGIVAVVNDDAISLLDLESRVSMVIVSSKLPKTQETRTRIRAQVLRNLIDEKLMLQKAKNVGIVVPQRDITERLQSIASRNKLTIEQLSAKMKKDGVAITALSSRFEAEMAWQIYIFRDLARSINIGDQEITDEINLIQSNAGKPEYLLAEIFLPVDNSKQDHEVRQLSLRLSQELQKGASFKNLATGFSRAPSAAIGGDMGWVQLNYLPEELKAAVQRLKPGQLSLPIRSIGGYFLIVLRDVRRSPGLASDNDMMKVSQLHVSVSKTSTQAQTNTIAQNLSTYATSLKGCAQLDAAPSRPGYPFAKSSLSGSMGKIKLSTLPQNMQRILAPLAVGQASQPVATGGGLAVMMICERQKAGVNMQKTRAKISQVLKKRRLDIIARRSLHDLRKDAFVDIRQ